MFWIFWLYYMYNNWFIFSCKLSLIWLDCSKQHICHMLHIRKSVMHTWSRHPIYVQIFQFPDWHIGVTALVWQCILKDQTGKLFWVILIVGGDVLLVCGHDYNSLLQPVYTRQPHFDKQRPVMQYLHQKSRKRI